MKETDAETDAVIINEIDSIGLQGGVIAGFSQNKYFVVNTEVGSKAAYFIEYEKFNLAVQENQKGELQLQIPSVFFEP